MRINVTKKGKGLEKISKGDVLVFKDREETVDKVDMPAEKLYTKMTVQWKFIIGEELIVYSQIKKIYPESESEVYDFVRLKRKVA